MFTVKRLGLFWILLACVPSTSAAESLLDAIRLAYETNPGLRAQREELRADDEGYVQARAGYGPQINVSGQVADQAARVQEPGSIFTRAGITDFGATTGSVDLSVVQPLYTAGAVGAGVRSAAAGVLASRENLRRAESQLILNVVTAYVDVTRDRQTLQVLRDEIAVLTVEFKETEAKAALGALSKTDSAQAEARLLAAQSQLRAAQGRLDSSDAEYLNVVGQSPGELQTEPELPGLPETVDEAFNAADQNNAQVLSAMQTERAAREQINQARAANGPNISIRLDAAMAPTEPYLPRQYDQSLTAALVFSQPIFTSGLNSSKIREAVDKDRGAELDIESARRSVVQLVAQAWAQLVSTRNAITIDERQVDVERTAAEGSRLEERAGLRTTIDLLNAETELADSQINLLQSRHDEYIARATLLSGMGLLEARFLTPLAQTFSPEISLKRVEAIGAAPWERAVGVVDSVGAPNSPAPRISPPGAGTDRPVGLPPMPKITP